MRTMVSREQDGLTLTALLRQCAPEVPPWAVREALRQREVRIDGVRTGQDIRVRAGQEVRAFFPRSAIAAQEKALPEPRVIYEDGHVLIIDKPQGIASQNEEEPLKGDTALTRTIQYLRRKGEDAQQVRLCHRLDVQTGGLLMLTKDEAAFESARQAFSERTFQKFYTCLVKGCPSQREAVMHAYLRKDAEIARVAVTDYPARGAQEIITGYRVLEAGEHARLEVELITGRTHQIRAHLAHIGHPILGDDKYGDRLLNRQLGLRRQQLWATRLVVHAEGALSYLNGSIFTTDCPF